MVARTARRPKPLLSAHLRWAARPTTASTADDLEAAADEVTSADMTEEYNDWMVAMVESGEAGSPYLSLDGP